MKTRIKKIIKHIRANEDSYLTGLLTVEVVVLSALVLYFRAEAMKNKTMFLEADMDANWLVNHALKSGIAEFTDVYNDKGLQQFVMVYDLK